MNNATVQYGSAPTPAIRKYLLAPLPLMEESCRRAAISSREWRRICTPAGSDRNRGRQGQTEKIENAYTPASCTGSQPWRLRLTPVPCGPHSAPERLADEALKLTDQVERQREKPIRAAPAAGIGNRRIHNGRTGAVEDEIWGYYRAYSAAIRGYCVGLRGQSD